jgi:ATP phosphoribosyltransferase
MTNADRANLLAAAKLALRITTDVFDAEIIDLVDAAVVDLGIAGVTLGAESEIDAIVRRAVMTYCRLNFGQPDDYDRLKASYDEQKAQLVTATGYTEWG